jgi:hypothetical protein
MDDYLNWLATLSPSQLYTELANCLEVQSIPFVSERARRRAKQKEEILIKYMDGRLIR